MAPTRHKGHPQPMLSYQHAYHAGNAADLHKHAALAALLVRLTAKDRGVTYLETHAGRALYDLAAPEAVKTGEAAAGIGAARVAPDSPYGRALAAVRAAHGAAAYPGSPMIAHALLRPQDRIVLMERHPQEAAALRRVMRGRTGGAEAAVHARDGYEGALGVTPPPPGQGPRRGLVLIDPSYEDKDEYEAVARFVPRLLKRWPEAAVLVWYPVLPAGRHAALRGLDGARHEAAFAATRPGGMSGSGLLLANPPYGAADDLSAGLRDTSGVLRDAREETPASR